MKNKTLEFFKNAGIASVSFLAGGVVGAELSDLLTDNTKIITAVSTITPYVLGYATFMGLQAYDNIEVYKKKTWDYMLLAKDTAKTFFAFGLAEIPYVITRSWSMDYFLNKDYSSIESSIMADLIALPVWIAIAYPLAKKTGIIKKD